MLKTKIEKEIESKKSIKRRKNYVQKRNNIGRQTARYRNGQNVLPR